MYFSGAPGEGEAMKGRSLARLCLLSFLLAALVVGCATREAATPTPTPRAAAPTPTPTPTAAPAPTPTPPPTEGGPPPPGGPPHRRRHSTGSQAGHPEDSLPQPAPRPGPVPGPEVVRGRGG